MAHEAATGPKQAHAVAGTTHAGRRFTRTSPARRPRPEAADPVAVVMGDIDMVRALGLAGVSSVLFDDAPSAARFSRHVGSVLAWSDATEHPREVIETLLAFARTQPVAPVLFPQSDQWTLLASRNRDELGRAFRFVLPDADLVEQLIAKDRFQLLADGHGLPVPSARRLRPSPGQDPRSLNLRFPVVIKPVSRNLLWDTLAVGGKAFHVADADALAVLWPRLIEADTEILAQEVVDGPESKIESFHAYVDARGDVAGSFTGRKIRTYPERYGHSTAVEVTALPDVARLGRDVLARIGYRGVAKADFKRDPQGQLHLLEINPRFNLWHLPGAIAGVNLPALVYADVTGRPRPTVRPARSGVTWCRPMRDVRAAYVCGISPLRWLRWVRTCDAVAGLSREDPMPFVLGVFPATVGNQLSRALKAPFRRLRRHEA